MAKITIKNIIQAKQEGRKLTMLTAYDYPTAQLIDEAAIDIILVGDSLGMVALGYETTLPVTMEEMLHHTKAVKSGVKNSFVVADMPFMSYQTTDEEAVSNAGRFLKEVGAQAVKIEGGSGDVIQKVSKITDAGIPVMGHLGLTPQSINQLGGYEVQAKEKKEAKRLIQEANILEEVGIFALVLEKVPASLASEVSKSLKIPTIGIGAGVGCDGQVLVTADLLGLFTKFKPKFVKRYANLAEEMKKAFTDFRQEVENGEFPGEEHSY